MFTHSDDQSTSHTPPGLPSENLTSIQKHLRDDLRHTIAQMNKMLQLQKETFHSIERSNQEIKEAIVSLTKLFKIRRSDENPVPLHNSTNTSETVSNSDEVCMDTSENCNVLPNQTNIQSDLS